jgi:type II secretory pathway pseudopilin PulG
MKTSRFIPVVMILIALSSFGTLNAQEKITKEKEKELQMQEAIDAQKKAIVEQQKSQEELKKLLEEQNINLDEVLKKAQENMPDPQQFNRAYRIYDATRGGSRTYIGEPFLPGGDLFGHYGEDTERTTWDFSKSIRESTFARDYTFDVDATVKTVVMSVNGDCKAGDIRIKITMPNGKTYSDIVIDEFGNLNWRKSFNISETENKDKTGAWKFDISASKATGYFKISLQTF